VRPTMVALLCAVVPFFAVHITLVNSIAEGHLPLCIPHIEGCFTISRAARSGSSLHIFRATMLPTSTLLLIYWLYANAWLLQLKNERKPALTVMTSLGVAGALFLILYATYLGTEGEFYRWMRRYGVTFYFSFTALAQIFFARRLHQLSSMGVVSCVTNLIRLKWMMCIFQWAIGLLSIPLGLVINEEDTRNAVQNIVEWNFALAMHVYFFLTYLMYRRTGFRLDFSLARQKCD